MRSRKPPRRAIDLLGGYLEQEPEAADAEQVRAMLKRARGEVAKWN